jgi:hypothetical protein
MGQRQGNTAIVSDVATDVNTANAYIPWLIRCTHRDHDVSWHSTPLNLTRHDANL